MDLGVLAVEGHRGAVRKGKRDATRGISDATLVMSQQSPVRALPAQPPTTFKKFGHLQCMLISRDLTGYCAKICCLKSRRNSPKMPSEMVFQRISGIS